VSDPFLEEKCAEFEDAFYLFDNDGNGVITAEELGVVMRTFRTPLGLSCRVYLMKPILMMMAPLISKRF
jgi:Ca2+-binding EF-hand superfamily protein